MWCFSLSELFPASESERPLARARHTLSTTLSSVVMTIIHCLSRGCGLGAVSVMLTGTIPGLMRAESLLIPCQLLLILRGFLRRMMSVAMHLLARMPNLLMGLLPSKACHWLLLQSMVPRPCISMKMWAS